MKFFLKKSKLIKNLIMILLIGGISLAIINRYQYFLWATFNECCTRWEFKLPQPKEEFIIRSEGVDLPRVLERLLTLAFPEYKITYKENARAPHLLITGYYGKEEESWDQQAVRAPYFALSIENKSVRWRRFRATGYPFAEFVSRKKETDNFIFLPFFIYAYDSLKDILEEAMHQRPTATPRSHQVAYIASDCTPEREGIFHALRQRLGGDQAIGMGECSTTPGHKAPGGYGDLDALLKDYNFVIAAENRDYKGYVTEKIINAYKVGAIPIYWGDADTVREFFNPDSFMDVTQYASFEELADAVVALTKEPAELQKKLRVPLFKDNKIPDFLLINEKHLTPEAEKILKEMAKRFRRLYDEYVDKRKNRQPYGKALDWSLESLS